MLDLCKKALPDRSKYKEICEKKCYREKNHSGACAEFSYLADLAKNYPRVASKIVRDSTMTTGAAWKSEDAGPNRIPRQVMQHSDAVLLKFGLNMKNLKQGVVAKLREKAANYEDCMSVAVKLTWLAYQMPHAPVCPKEIKDYLENRIAKMTPDSTTCIICKEPLSFSLFEKALRGKAEIETAHSNPREHNDVNVGFAHRECNIAQGNKTLNDFYDWIHGILIRVGKA